METELQQSQIPLCVDLDGTLVRSDTLCESLLLLLRRNPDMVFKTIPWILRGKAVFKAEVASRIQIDPATLPYRQDLLHYLRAEAAHRPLVLATASNEKTAQQISSYLGFFTDVVASTATLNLKGRNKAETLIEKFGRQHFDYVGNGQSDMHIWEAARGAILVNPSRGMLRVAEKRFKVIKVFSQEQSRLLLWVKALRIHQWSKNLLVFAPLIAAHKYFSTTQLFDCCLGFAAYCLIASGVYLLNDLLDLDADRAHPTKSRRPLASGMLPIPQAVALIPILLVAGFSICSLLPRPFLLVLEVYYVTTLAYTYWLKQVPLVDVLVLAGLYIVRVVGGAAAVNVPLSFWMMAFALFFFFSLGLAKRFTELKHLRRGKDEQLKGRQYMASDLEQIASLGAASGYVSTLVLALYLNSIEVSALYSRPQVLWGACPIELYWISRVWLLAHRGQLHDDPVVFAIKDRASYVILFLAACLLIAAGPK